MGSQNVGTGYVASYYESRIRSTGLGVCNTVGRMGGVTGPTLGGFLVGAALPMIVNCVAFAVPGAIAAAAYALTRRRAHDAELERMDVPIVH